MILITHDLGVVADVADDIVIMYSGRPMERADAEAAFTEPHHPYTQGLLQSIPSYAGRSGRLRADQGLPAVGHASARRVPVRQPLPVRAPRVPGGRAPAARRWAIDPGTCRPACCPPTGSACRPTPRRHRRAGVSASAWTFVAMQVVTPPGDALLEVENVGQALPGARGGGRPTRGGPGPGGRRT